MYIGEREREKEVAEERDEKQNKRGGKVKEEQRELGINSFFLSSPSVFYGIFFFFFFGRRVKRRVQT